MELFCFENHSLLTSLCLNLSQPRTVRHSESSTFLSPWIPAETCCTALKCTTSWLSRSSLHSWPSLWRLMEWPWIRSPQPSNEHLGSVATLEEECCNWVRLSQEGRGNGWCLGTLYTHRIGPLDAAACRQLRRKCLIGFRSSLVGNPWH